MVAAWCWVVVVTLVYVEVMDSNPREARGTKDGYSFEVVVSV